MTTINFENAETIFFQIEHAIGLDKYSEVIQSVIDIWQRAYPIWDTNYAP